MNPPRLTSPPSLALDRKSLPARVAGSLVIGGIRSLSHLVCEIDSAELARVPSRGPLILICNHVNFLDVPIFYVHLQPRRMTVLTKTETWKHPLLGPLFTLFGGIPLRRGEADTGAVRAALDVLRAGDILAIAPEGTRSSNGQLQRAQPGMVTVALKSGAPILPMVSYGEETFRANSRRLRRTPFHIAVGTPFYLQSNGGAVTQNVRRQIADEIMYQLAALLPAANRGYYADVRAATEIFLRFPMGAQSNLARARGDS